MTAFRLISFPTHAAIELVLGLAMMAAPFVLGFGGAGTLVAVTVGALVVGLALGAAAPDNTSRIDISAHYAYDLGLAIGLVGAAVVLAVAGDAVASTFFAVVAVAQLALNATTRYSFSHRSHS